MPSRPGSGPGGGKIGQQFPELTPSPRGQRLPGSLVELSGGQPARLEVLAQVRHGRITVGIGSPHCSGKNIPSHGIHRALAFLSRAVVSGFRVGLLSPTEGYPHHCRMPPAAGDICHGPWQRLDILRGKAAARGRGVLLAGR